MTALKYLIFVLIILYLLNNIKLTKKKIKTKETMSPLNNDNIINLNQNNRINPNLYFGKDQYMINSEFNNNIKFNYQNLDINNKSAELNITNNLNYPNETFLKSNYLHNPNYNINYFDNRNLANQLKDNKININPKISKENIIKNFNEETTKAVVGTSLYSIKYPPNFVSKNVIVDPVIDQKILYDYRFLDMHNENLEDIIHNNNLDSKLDKSIKEVYDSLILDYKNINQKLKPNEENKQIAGAFNESGFPIDEWTYENDNKNKLFFDPLQPLQLSL
jgi:hypothetical protein